MSHLIDLISQPFKHNSSTSSTAVIIVTTALTTLLSITISRLVFKEKEVKIVKSPAATLLPHLSQAEKDVLPYPADAFPGGRDVHSPYGTIRLYEWGPEDGRKVLFVHGITTSCLEVGAIAHRMAERGCRVMTFDLWGEGYSDSPADLPHDERLYSTQILLAITSSPLSWAGNSGFSLIGYSLGGGISVVFTSYFPNLVNSLVLLAPTSLIREDGVARQKKLLSLVSLLPKSVLEMFLKKKLQRPLFPTKVSKDQDSINAAVAEAKAEVESETTPNLPTASVSFKYPDITITPAVQWQVQVHAGFCTSFMSTIRHAPAQGQEESWKRLRLRKDKILIITGSSDPIIKAKELKEDVLGLVGADKIEWRLIDGAHDIPTSDPGRIVNEICSFWKI